MAENTLDRLDREPGGARQYVAQLFVVGGATREQVAAQLHKRFGVKVTTRSISKWKAEDAELRRLIDELEEVRRDLAPDASAADVLANIPAPVDRAQVCADLLTMTIKFPAFGRLMHREYVREKAAPENDGRVWGDTPAASGGSFPESNEAFRAMMEGEGKSDEEFEQDCIRRLGDYEEEHLPTDAGSLA